MEVNWLLDFVRQNSEIFAAMLGAGAVLVAEWWAKKEELKTRRAFIVLSPLLREVDANMGLLLSHDIVKVYTSLSMQKWLEVKFDQTYIASKKTAGRIDPVYENIRGYNAILRNTIVEVNSYFAQKLFENLTIALPSGALSKGDRAYKEMSTKFLEKIGLYGNEIMAALIYKDDSVSKVSKKDWATIETAIVQCYPFDNVTLYSYIKKESENGERNVRNIINESCSQAFEEVFQSPSFQNFLKFRRELHRDGTKLQVFLISKISEQRID